MSTPTSASSPTPRRRMSAGARVVFVGDSAVMCTVPTSLTDRSPWSWPAKRSSPAFGGAGHGMAHVARIVGDRGTGGETLLRLRRAPERLGAGSACSAPSASSAPRPASGSTSSRSGSWSPSCWWWWGRHATTDGVEAAVDEALRQLPDLFDPFWAIAYDLLAVAALASYTLAVVRGRWRLGVAMTATISCRSLPPPWSTTPSASAPGLDALQLGSDIDGAPVQLVVALAMTLVAARELSRPFRTASRRLVLAGTIGVFLLPATTPFRNCRRCSSASPVAALIRYAFGSPVSSVSAGDIKADLADLGTVAEPVDQWSEGVHEAVTPAATASAST